MPKPRLGSAPGPQGLEQPGKLAQREALGALPRRNQGIPPEEDHADPILVVEEGDENRLLSVEPGEQRLGRLAVLVAGDA